MPIDTETRPVHVPRGSRTRWFLGGRVDIHLTAEDTDGWLCLHEHTLPAGAASPLHVHPTDEESYLVLEGVIELWVDGDVHRAIPGDAGHLPRGTRHAFRVISAGGARVLAIGTPAGHEQFFLEAGAPGDRPEPAPGPVDPDRIEAAAAAGCIEVLGPPPFGPR